MIEQLFYSGNNFVGIEFTDFIKSLFINILRTALWSQLRKGLGFSVNCTSILLIKNNRHFIIDSLGFSCLIITELLI